MREITTATTSVAANLVARPGLNETLRPGTVYTVECRRDGELVWQEVFTNTVVTVGKNDMLTQYFKGSSYTATPYVGLKGTGTISASDTMSSHGGWSEFTSYSGSRGTLTLGTASGGSIDNSASRATFSITGSGTVAGAFITNNSTAGGTTGTLYSVGDFSASRSVISGDVLSVQATVTLT